MVNALSAFGGFVYFERLLDCNSFSFPLFGPCDILVLDAPGFRRQFGCSGVASLRVSFIWIV